MRWITAALAAFFILITFPGLATGQESTDPADEFRAFFATFKDALEKRDQERILASFDVERMWAEIRATSVTEEISPAQERIMLYGIRLGLGGQVAANAEMWLWERLTVERARPRAEGTEAVVTTRSTDADGLVSRTRWWLIRGENGWRIFDQEEAGTGLRFSLITSASLGTLLEGNAGVTGALKGLMEASIALYEGEIEEAEHILTTLPEVELPARLESLKLFLIGSIDTWNGRPARALTRFDAAEKANPEMVVVDRARAEALLDLERPGEALTCIRRFLAGYGEDAESRIYEGLALGMLERREEAVESFRMALTESPEYLEALISLAMALPEGKKVETAAWFRRHPDPVESFWGLFEALIEEEEPEAAVAVLAAFRELAPESALSDVADGWLHANADRFEQAAACYRRALPRIADPEERVSLQDSYLDAMVRAGKPVEGYQALHGSSRAFREICGQLVTREDGEAILEVARAHAKEVPDDLWLSYYRGKGRTLTGDHEGAEEAYAVGMARAADDETREEFRHARVENLYQAGRGLSAYGKVGPRRATFRDLADNFSLDEDAESLAVLVGAHARADPKDAALRLYRGEILFILGEWEATAKLLEGLQGTLAEEPDLLVVWEDRLVRALARLGRVEDAMKVAKASTARDDDPWFEAVVHAIAGDVKETGRVLNALGELGYGAEDFWSDEDLARALEREEFENLRTRYPRPE